MKRHFLKSISAHVDAPTAQNVPRAEKAPCVSAGSAPTTSNAMAGWPSAHGLLRTSILFLATLALAHAQPTLEQFYQPLSATSRPITYRVREGDTLFTIAGRLLGDPYQARLLQQVNKIEDPLRLEPGRSLQVPMPALGIVYSIQKPADCDLLEVNERHNFRAGDRFRLRLTTNIDGYLYLFNRRPNGDYVRLNANGQRVKAFADYSLPGSGNNKDEWYRFDAEQGAEELIVLVSPTRLTELDSDLAASEARRRIQRLLDSSRGSGTPLGEAASGLGRSLAIASPVDDALVLAHRIVLKKQ